MKGITSELEYDAVNVFVYKYGWGCNNGGWMGGGGGVMISSYELRRTILTAR